MNQPLSKSFFYDFITRYVDMDFESYLAQSTLDEDYINWHEHCLPYAYDDAEKEYDAVRTGCALFDASPVKKYRIRGSNSGALLDYMMTRSMSKLPVMRATYAIWCNEDGMLNDDAILYKLAEDDYLLMIAEIDHDALLATCKEKVGGDVEIAEETPSLAGFAVQGPKSCAVLNSFGFAGIENMKPFELAFFNLNGGEVMVSRVGFTADLGYEIWFKPEMQEDIEQAFTRAEESIGIQIAGYGLTAIQLCRMEGGFIVPGWDTAQTFEDSGMERTPAELAIGWNVDLDRDDEFVGKDALINERNNGPRFKMKGFIIDDECELEDGAELFTEIDGEEHQVGTLPSVSWSYNAGHWLGLSSLKIDYANLAEAYVRIDGQKTRCTIRDIPFINLERRSLVPAPM
jgi:aminomethyltransferase